MKSEQGLLSNDEEEEADISLYQKCSAWCGLTRIFCYVTCSKIMSCRCLKKKQPRKFFNVLPRRAGKYFISNNV